MKGAMETKETLRHWEQFPLVGREQNGKWNGGAEEVAAGKLNVLRRTMDGP